MFKLINESISQSIKIKFYRIFCGNFFVYSGLKWNSLLYLMNLILKERKRRMNRN